MASPAMGVDNVTNIKDKDWVRSSFMLAVNRWKPDEGRLNKENKEWLYFTTANYKAANTSLGGNVTINSLAQYTRYCDLPRGGLSYSDVKGTYRDKSMAGGMGRYYSEAIDDWSMKVAFRFGMPEYKGLITFFTSFYDVGAAMLGRQGRLTKGLFYTGAKIITSLIALPLTVMVWVGEAVQWLSNRPSTRYYNLKPAMALYWQRVNLIANMMAANMGLTPRDPRLTDPDKKNGAADLDSRFSQGYSEKKDSSYAFEFFKESYPNMFMKHGGIDIYYMANKYERMHHDRNLKIKHMLEQNSGDWLKTIKQDIDKHVKNYAYRDVAQPRETLDNYLSKYHSNRFGFADLTDPDFSGEDSIARYTARKVQDSAETGQVGSTSVGTIEGDMALSEGATVEGQAESQSNPEGAELLIADSADDGLIYPILVEDLEKGDGSLKKQGGWAWGETLKDYATSVAADGGQWVNFRVDTVKSVDESFTNTVGPSEIQGKINGLSSSASAVRFGMSDFNTGLPIIDGVVQAVRDTFAGVADGLHIGGLAALMGGGFVDIPQRWMDSATNLPTASYTIKCRPPYGNIMSRFLNMHVIVACFLAAALPISYGRHAYGAPMLCEMYVQGKNQSRLAMITSLSITRGEGNLGWSKDGDFLGCDINFEVTDLSTIMHAPIDSGMQVLGNFRWIMSDDNVFNDYMAVLSNLSVAEMSYSWEKLKLNWQRYKTTQQTFFSPARVAMVAGDTNLGRFVRKINPNQNQSIK